MSKKIHKDKNPKGLAKKKPTASSAHPANSRKWVIRILIAFLGAVFTYFVFPRLQFSLEVNNGISFAIGLLIFFLILWGSSNQFKNLGNWLVWAVAGLIALQLVVNVSLQFGWMESTSLLQAIATVFIFPSAALWACVLLHAKVEDQQPIATTSFFKEFSRPIVLIPALLVLGAGCVMIFYRLGYYDFWEDEGMVINAAVGLRDEGFKFLKEGYDRAWFHSWLVSLSIQVFGESEWSARLPSALSGVLFILLSYYIFYKWLRWPVIAILIPLVCLLTDEFLILFRYTRMYALLIPLFLTGMYLIYVFLTKETSKSKTKLGKENQLIFDVGYGVATLAVMGLAFHIHALAVVGFLGAFFLVIILWMTTHQQRYKILLILFFLLGTISTVLGLADLEVFRMIPKAFKRMMMPNAPEYAYYQFLFNNGLPVNMTLLCLTAGAGLLFNKNLELSKKHVLSFLYLIVLLDFLFMTYLLADEGRDFRYIAHIVPLVIAIELLVLYATSKLWSNRWLTICLVSLPLLYAAYTFTREYRELYIKHPWSPRYSIVYPDIKGQYKEGEALFYQNMKAYYLDPETLAGDHAIRMGRRMEYNLDQFTTALKNYPAAWVVFDTHKAYHVDPEIIKYISRNFEKLHGTGVDDTGVEVFHLKQ